MAMNDYGPLEADMAALGCHLRYDPERPPPLARWTAYITGRGRGDGHTPEQAVANLRAALEARERDAVFQLWAKQHPAAARSLLAARGPSWEPVVLTEVNGSLEVVRTANGANAWARFDGDVLIGIWADGCNVRGGGE